MNAEQGWRSTSEGEPEGWHLRLLFLYTATYPGAGGHCENVFQGNVGPCLEDCCGA